MSESFGAETVEIGTGKEPTLEELRKILDMMGMSMTSVLLFFDRHPETLQEYGCASPAAVRAARDAIEAAVYAVADMASRVEKYGGPEDPLMKLYDGVEGGHA